MTNKEKELIIMKLNEINSCIKDIVTIISYTDESEDIEEQIRSVASENNGGQKLNIDLNSLENEIGRVITEIGVRYSNVGFKYIIEGVTYLYHRRNDKASVKISVTKELYPHIAKKFNTTPSRVERAIRHEVTHIHKRGNMDKYLEIFPYWDLEKETITNSNFMFGLTYFISKKLAVA